MKRVIAGVTLIAFLLTPLSAFASPGAAVVGAGSAYAAGTYLAIPAGTALVATPAGTAAAASFGLTSSQGVAAVVSRGLVPQALDAGLVSYAPSTPDAIFGVSTPTLIVSAAVGLAAYILYQAITGELQPPTVSLVKEGYSKPSGKAYRYHK